MSVCIPSRNRPESLSRMIESLLLSDYENFEIIVVDNSDDNFIPFNRDVLSADERTIHILADKKIGIAALRQLAFENSRGDIVLCADDDIEVPKDWMACIVKAFERDPYLGIWGCRVLNHDEMGRVNNQSFHGGPKAKGENGAFHPPKPGEDICTFGETNLALRRNAVIKVGGFDSRFIWGYEGADLTNRILRAGYNLHFESGITINHWANKSKTRPRMEKADYFRLLFFFKYNPIKKFSIVYEIKRIYYLFCQKNYRDSFWGLITLFIIPFIFLRSRKDTHMYLRTDNASLTPKMPNEPTTHR